MMENKKEIKTYYDYDIFNGKVKVVGEKGIEILDRNLAIDMAHDMGLNLVQIAYNKNDTVKPVCKMFNLSKFKYEQKKREKKQKRKAKIANAEAKEVSFSIRIDVGDKNTKIDHIRKFLVEDNEKVKIIVRLSKREMNLIGMAKKLMRDIITQLDDIAELDTNPSFMSGILSCTVRQKK